MKIIGLVVNPKRKDVTQLVNTMIKWLKDKGDYRLIMESDTATVLQHEEFSVPVNEMKYSDLILAMGGDGTLLHAVRIIEGSEIPILGVNLGSLGFLTEVTQDELYSTLENVLNGRYSIERRMMIEAKIIKSDKVIADFKALNDAVITEADIARMITLKVTINSEYLTTYKADGLIISTPTGSTAYSLAAGGPIIDPKMKVLMLTPICPHTLTVRPMIITEDSIITVEPISQNRAILTIDGQQVRSLVPPDKVEIRKASQEICLITPQQRSFYQVLRSKLRWSGGIIIS